MIAAWRRVAVISRDSCHAQAVDNALKAGQIRPVVGKRRPAGAGAGDGEGRAEREAGLDCGMRLVKSAKVREGGGQPKKCWRIISVGLDRPSKPSDSLLPNTKVELRPGPR